MANVKFDDVWKVYPDGTEAVKELTLEIEDGEFVILVGPSGCGKSTALRMVAGLEDISRGKMVIGDKVVNDLTPKERDIAMVFQSYALYPHMTVYDNMGFALKLAKVDKDEIDERVRENLIDQEVSIGDYVLTNGTLAAAVLIDCLSRFLPGFLGEEKSLTNESFQDNLLDFPQFTRPAVFRNMPIPEVLLSGNHAEIEKWRQCEREKRTLMRRPDLLEDSP